MAVQEVNDDWDDESSALPSSRQEKQAGGINLVAAMQNRLAKVEGGEEEEKAKKVILRSECQDQQIGWSMQSVRSTEVVMNTGNLVKKQRWHKK